MSVKPSWKVIIGSLIALAVIILLAIIIAYLIHGTTIHEIEIFVPDTTITVIAVFGNTTYRSTTNVLGGEFYETTSPTISTYASALSGVLSGTVANGSATMNNAATFTYNQQVGTFTVSLNKADAISIQSSNNDYWKALGFGVANTIVLTDDNIIPTPMTSLTSAPIRVQPDIHSQ